MNSHSFPLCSQRPLQLQTLWNTLNLSSNALELCRQAASLTDAAVLECFSASQFPSSVCLVATGGYGRGLLWPHSDVDLLILYPETQVDLPALESSISTFSSLLWDARIEPGLLARPIESCASLSCQDVTIFCSMLESRYLTGDETLLSHLRALLSTLSSQEFFTEKMREQRERHARHGDSPFCLEPHLKEAPGTLRDLQMPFWIARTLGLEPTWNGLQKAGLLTGGEAELAQACETRISLMRAVLHHLQGRMGERLTFDLQTQMAQFLGIGPEAGKTPAAVLMDGFFSCARNVTMINEVLLSGLESRVFPSSQPPQPIDDHFFTQDSTLELYDPNLFALHPSRMMDAFLIAQQHSSVQRMGPILTRALWRASRRVDAWFRADVHNRAQFLRMIQSHQGPIAALVQMAKVGLLGAYLPAFGRAETLMQHDLFHAYTVGRHTLGVLRNLRRFIREDRAQEMPAITEIARSFSDYWVLYLGALFHDIAKGRGGSHEEQGVEDARTFCQAHCIDPTHQSLVEFLVRWHLEMSRVSQKEDLQDPEVIQAFALRCGSVRFLDALYLLTIADMKATGPTVWNAWKGSLLDDLWRQSRFFLLNQSEAPDDKVQRLRQKTAQWMADHGASESQIQHYCKDLSEVGYFATTSTDDSQWHTQHAALSWGKSSIIEVRHLHVDHPHRIQAFFTAPDQPGLFLRFCVAMARLRANVLSAKLHSTPSGWILDTFEFEVSQDISLSAIRDTLHHWIFQATNLPSPTLGRVSSRARHVGVAQALMSPSNQDWLLEVSAPDRSGLLWMTAEILQRHRIRLKSARITTVGERAEDVFIVHAPHLEHERHRSELQRELIHHLRTDVNPPS